MSLVVPRGTELLIVSLSDLGETRGDRPSGAVTNYRMVNRVAGTDDKITDVGLYDVHSFGATLAEAEDRSWETHYHILDLGPPLTYPKTVIIRSGPAQVETVGTEMTPRWVKYVDDGSIYRYVARYRVTIRFVAAQ